MKRCQPGLRLTPSTHGSPIFFPASKVEIVALGINYHHDREALDREIPNRFRTEVWVGRHRVCLSA